MLSKRQVLLKYGYNDKTFRRLIVEGVVQVEIKPGKRSTISVHEASLEALQEGIHYVVCRQCGARQSQMTTKHLRHCSGMSLGEYRKEHPKATILSSFSAQNKRKTPLQRQAQSDCLKQRFQTEEGKETRQQISEASKQMHKNGYREIASKHLRAYGNSVEGRKRRQELTQEYWDKGSLRESVTTWHRENREQSLASIANARRHLKRTSALHLRFKETLVEAGVEGLQTEYPVAWYSIDEAHPELKFALEVDGCYWHNCAKCGFNGNPRSFRIDRAKTSYLERRGWVVLRIPEHDLRKDLARCVELVKSRLARFSV